jgi:hypothetical protein
LPDALGIFGLTTEQLEAMTIREYKAKREGFFEYQNAQLKQQAWLIGLMSMRGFNASEKQPYPSLDEFMNVNHEKETINEDETTNKELFQLAQEKGVIIPEGMVV